MRWSGLSNVQRAYVMAGARYNKDTVVSGRVVRRGDAKSSKAEAVKTLHLIDQDLERERNKLGAGLMNAALAAFTPDEISRLATKCDPGRAYGSKELNRKRAGAMPLNFYRGTQYGG